MMKTVNLSCPPVIPGKVRQILWKEVKCGDYVNDVMISGYVAIWWATMWCVGVDFIWIQYFTLLCGVLGWISFGSSILRYFKWISLWNSNTTHLAQWKLQTKLILFGSSILRYFKWISLWNSNTTHLAQWKLQTKLILFGSSIFHYETVTPHIWPNENYRQS